jgi:hypothetical protein
MIRIKGNQSRLPLVTFLSTSDRVISTGILCPNWAFDGGIDGRATVKLKRGSLIEDWIG